MVKKKKIIKAKRKVKKRENIRKLRKKKGEKIEMAKKEENRKEKPKPKIAEKQKPKVEEKHHEGLEERRYKFRRIYAAFFVIGLTLTIASILTEDWFSFGIAILIDILSIIFYGKKKKLGIKGASRAYLLVWILSLILAGASIFNKKYVSLGIALITMFFCSCVAQKTNRHVKENIIADDIKEMQKTTKLYETNFDKILILLKKYKRIKVSRLSNGFKVEKEKIEDWAHILEEHGLLEVHYPPFSEPELRIMTKEVKKEKEESESS